MAAQDIFALLSFIKTLNKARPFNILENNRDDVGIVPYKINDNLKQLLTRESLTGERSMHRPCMQEFSPL